MIRLATISACLMLALPAMADDYGRWVEAYSITPNGLGQKHWERICADIDSHGVLVGKGHPCDMPPSNDLPPGCWIVHPDDTHSPCETKQ